MIAASHCLHRVKNTALHRKPTFLLFLHGLHAIVFARAHAVVNLRIGMPQCLQCPICSIGLAFSMF
jgi:hypothetical protein